MNRFLIAWALIVGLSYGYRAATKRGYSSGHEAGVKSASVWMIDYCAGLEGIPYVDVS
jgi:hypothetical protein